MKTCFKCNKTKELDKFYRHPQMGDGHLNKCKECTKKDVSENYRVNRDHYSEYEKERFKRPERKAKAIKYQQKRRALSPGKYRANYMVTHALKNGTLVKQPCEKCGNQKSEAHHDDYRRPLAVRWLCRKHHLEHHGKQAY